MPLFAFPGGLIAHEVSHQWWYGLVGNDQVDAGYLSEGLATFSETFLPVEQARALDPALAARTWDGVRQSRRASVLVAYWSAGGRRGNRPPRVRGTGWPARLHQLRKSIGVFPHLCRSVRAGGAAGLPAPLRGGEPLGIATLDTMQGALEEAAPGHEGTVRLLVTDWFRRANAARVIDMHALPLAPAPRWLAATQAVLGRTAPGLRAIGLRPEVLLQIGYNPTYQATRTYATREGVRVLSLLVRALRRAGWASPLGTLPSGGLAEVQLTNGGHMLTIIVVSWRYLTPAQRHLLAGKVGPEGTLVTIQA